MPKESHTSDRLDGPPGSEFLDALQEMNCDWATRANAEVEHGLTLTKKLTAAHSAPEAIAAYQEWFREEMGARAEDTRLLISIGQKFIDASSRLLSSSWTGSRPST
jgi:hypothetical protein